MRPLDLLAFFYRILHKDGFSRQDLELIRPVVISNTIHSMLAILRAMFHLQIDYGDPERLVGVVRNEHSGLNAFVEGQPAGVRHCARQPGGNHGGTVRSNAEALAGRRRSGMLQTVQ